MSQDQIDYKAIRQRVEEGVQKQKRATRIVFFVVSLFMLIFFSLIGWGIASSQGVLNDDMVGALVMTSMAGFMGVMFQFISLFLDTKAGEASMRDKLIARELGEEMLRMGAEDDVQQKQKRAMRLAADGELEEIVDNSASDVIVDEEAPRQRRSGGE